MSRDRNSFQSPVHFGSIFVGHAAKKIQSILVTQPKPTNDNSPYLAIAKKYGIKVDFREFIQVDPVVIKNSGKIKLTF